MDVAADKKRLARNEGVAGRELLDVRAHFLYPHFVPMLLFRPS